MSIKLDHIEVCRILIFVLVFILHFVNCQLSFQISSGWLAECYFHSSIQRQSKIEGYLLVIKTNQREKKCNNYLTMNINTDCKLNICINMMCVHTYNLLL